MKKPASSYLYNYYDADDGDGTPLTILYEDHIVKVGINVVLMPNIHFIREDGSSKSTTVIGSNSFIGRGAKLIIGREYPEGTIIQGDPMRIADKPFAKVLFVGDDFGRREESNLAIAHLFKEGVLHHASLMPNVPPLSQAALKLVQANGLSEKVGLHFNVTAGEPFSKLSSGKWYSTDERGNLGARMNGIRSAFFITQKEKRALVDELSLQIEWFKQNGLRPKWFDSHGNIHFKWPIAKAIVPLLIQNGFKHVRIPRTESTHHRIYNWLFRNRVLRLFRKYFETTDRFINAKDLFVENNWKFNGETIEIMLHPFTKNGHFINRRDVSIEVLLAFCKAMNIEVMHG